MAIISLILAFSLIFSPMTQTLSSFVNDAYTPGAKQVVAEVDIVENGEVIGNLLMDFKLSKDISEWDYKKDSAEFNFKLSQTIEDYNATCLKEEEINGDLVCTLYDYEEVEREETLEATFKIKDGALFVNRDFIASELVNDYSKDTEIANKIASILETQVAGDYLLIAKFEDLEKEAKESEEFAFVEQYKDSDFSNLEKITTELFEDLKKSVKDIGIKNTFIKYENNKLEITVTPEVVVDIFHQIVQYYSDNFEIIGKMIDNYANKLYEDDVFKSVLNNVMLVVEESEKISPDEEVTEEDELTSEEIEENIRNSYFDFVVMVKDGLKIALNETLTVLNAKEPVCTTEKIYDEDSGELEAEFTHCTQTKADWIKVFGNSKFVVIAEKTENGNVNIDTDLNVEFDDGIDSLGIKSKIKIINIDEFVSDINYTSTVEEYEKLFNKEYNKVDPYNDIRIIWEIYEDGVDNFAYVQLRRNDFYSNADEKQFYNIEGRIYLPMRYIAESFGETVEWDGENKKAYVVRGNEKIDMSGIIYDGTTYIKIRDFEKLGYTVSYEEDDWGSKIATVSRNK